MREINLNGYIDDEVWYGDEITPESLHESLYGSENQNRDGVHIRLNSYGGSCNAATRMYDDIRAYPGNVHITVSGTAASAGTVLAMAADKLEMTPGSLFMIHDPSTIAFGSERDMNEAINLLRACKESILNVYGKRCKKLRDEIAALMTATTWMDAQAALDAGFIDGITEDESALTLTDSAAPRCVDIKEAKAKVQAWLDRHQPSRPKNTGDDQPSSVPSVSGQTPRLDTPDGTAQLDPPEDSGNAVEPDPPEDPGNAVKLVTPEDPGTSTTTIPPETPGTPVAQLQKRLGLIMPTRR
ncbi:MAG: ATP-dependent Clp protease proteolytic subunit [Clostridia bacterium]